MKVFKLNKLLRKVYLLFFLLLYVSFLNAQTPSGFNQVVYEGFDYTSGLSLLNANGGIGWSTNWTKSYMSKYLKAGTIGFTYTGLVTSGLKAEFDDTCYDVDGISPYDCNAIASLGRSFPLQNDGVVYFQFISVLEASASGGTPNIRLFNGSVQTGGIGAISGSYMSILDASLSNLSSSSASLSTQNLVVVRIDYDLNKTEMWVNPNLSTFDYLNPVNPSATATNFAPVFDNFSIFIRSGSIDEIAIYNRITVLNKNGKLDTSFSSAVNKNGAIGSGNAVRSKGKSL